MQHLSSLLASAFVAGLAAGVLLEPPAHILLALILSASWAGAVLALLRGHSRIVLGCSVLLVAAGAWLLGAHAVRVAESPPLVDLVDTFAADEPIVATGRLVSDASVSHGGVTLRIDVSTVLVHGHAVAASGGISVGVAGAPPEAVVATWTAGRSVRAPALLRRPARYLNDGLPDQERALARRGIALVGTIKSAALVEVVAPGSAWDEHAAAIRARVRRALLRHVGPRARQSSAIGSAILIGDRSALGADTEQRLQEAGTYHVIAISGGNIAILTALGLGALSLLGLRGGTAAIATIATLGAYALIAAGGASVVRATLMASVYLGVRVIDQRTAAANAVSLTAVIALLANPLAIVDVGFWLTFGATLALLVSFKASKERDKASQASKASKVVGGLGGLVAATACVELALAPIGAFVFQRVTLAGLVLNVVAIPAMTLVQLAAMGVVAADVVGLMEVAAAFGWAVHAGTVALTESTRLLDYAPWLTWRVPPPSIGTLALYYASLITAVRFWTCSRRGSLRRPSAAMALALFACIVSAPAARIRAVGDGRLHLTMLDVGQGDAMLVTLPNGRTVLVDSGGGAPGSAFDIGDRVIGPTLRAQRRLSIDYLAITHGDPDHIGGARALVRDFAPREIWWGVPVPPHQPAALLRETADRTRAAWRTLQRGDRVELGGVELRVHHPPLPDWERQRVRNNDSLVLEFRFGSVSLLLTGDIGREVEHELLPTLDPLPLVVLKVPHHGSGTSSSAAFLERLRPVVALIGAGRRNPYGHPVPAVLGRLHDAGAEVFRTDLDGQIDVMTDGEGVEVRTYSGRSWKRR